MSKSADIAQKPRGKDFTNKYNKGKWGESIFTE